MNRGKQDRLDVVMILDGMCRYDVAIPCRPNLIVEYSLDIPGRSVVEIHIPSVLRNHTTVPSVVMIHIPDRLIDVTILDSRLIDVRIRGNLLIYQVDRTNVMGLVEVLGAHDVMGPKNLTRMDPALFS